MNKTEYFVLLDKWKREGLSYQEMSNRFIQLNNFQYNIKKQKEVERFFKLNRDLENYTFKEKFKELINQNI